MLKVGDPLPDATVFEAPGGPVRLGALASKGPILLLFYLFDWSST